MTSEFAAGVLPDAAIKPYHGHELSLAMDTVLANILYSESGLPNQSTVRIPTNTTKWTIFFTVILFQIIGAGCKLVPQLRGNVGTLL